MFTLTGFGDEISRVLKEQLDLMESVGISALELRGVEEKSVADFTDDDVTRFRKELDGRGFTVSCIGSPIGKIKITDDFPEHVRVFRRVIELAKAFGWDENHIQPSSVAEAGLRAPRPKDLSLNVTKVLEKISTPLLGLNAGITRFKEMEHSVKGELR